MSAGDLALPHNFIFICYRRIDSEEMVDRVYEVLKLEFGVESIFRDINTIPPGVDFPTYIEEALRDCLVALVFIGRDWVSCLDKRGRPRLHDPGDHVRVEIEKALALPDARVIPVFVRSAEIPVEDDLPESLRLLSRRKGIPIRSSGADYQRDVADLVAVLRRSVAEILEKRHRRAKEEERRAAAERERIAEVKRRELEEARQREVARLEEEQRKMEEQRRKEAEAERERIVEEQRRKEAEVERERIAEEKRRKLEEARQREVARLEEEQRKMEEQRRKEAEAEAERERIVEQRRREAEVERERIAEEKRQELEEARQREVARLEEEQRNVEEQRHKDAEAERDRIVEAEEARRRDEDGRRNEEADSDRKEPEIERPCAGQRVFGRFTLLRMLGRGGMGVVWLAHDDQMEEEVALKFLPEVVAADSPSLAQLKGEAQRSRHLAHPNIVRVFDFHQASHLAAISMEYIVGDTLWNLRPEGRQRPYNAEELRPWIKQICEALEYAHNHEAKIVHRDLKPGNMMLTDRGVLKIADFGIAASLAETMSRVSRRPSGGTLVYMSPQQLDGVDPTVADDLYSLGATLYDLLTGRPPFYQGGDIQSQVRERIPPSIAERQAKLGCFGAPIPETWEQTIAALLAKDPTQRPTSAAEVSWRLLESADSSSEITVLGETHPKPDGKGPELPTIKIEPAPPAKEDSSAVKIANSNLPPVAGDRGSLRPALLGGALLAGAVIFLIAFHFHRPPDPPKEPKPGISEIDQIAVQVQALEAGKRWREALAGWLGIYQRHPKDATAQAGIERDLSHLCGSFSSFSRQDFEALQGQIEQAARLGIPMAENLLKVGQLLTDAEQAEARKKWSDALKARSLLAESYAYFGFGPADLEKFFNRLNANLDDITPAEYEAMRGDIEKQTQHGVAAANTFQSQFLRKIDEERNTALQRQFIGEASQARKLEDARRWHDAVAAWLRLAKKNPTVLPQLKSCLASLSSLNPPLKPEEFAAMRQDVTEAAQVFDIAFAQLLLGDQLRKIDPATAFAWYCAAANNGEEAAMVRAAKMLLIGIGTTKNEGKAVAYLEMGVAAGNIGAAAMLGECYLTGKGVKKKDEKRGVELLRAASDGNDRVAKTTLAVCYDKGVGVEQDDIEAFRLFSEAAKLGDGLAIFNLGLLLSREEKNLVFKKGEKRVPDRKEAEEIVQRAFKKFKEDTDKGIGDDEAMYLRALCYEKGYLHETQREDQASKWYRKAAVAGNTKAIEWCAAHRVSFSPSPN